MSLDVWFPRLAALAVILFLGLSTADACQICLPYPTETLADRILDAERLVLSRENPEKPYTLAPIKTLKAGDGDPPELDLFLDSSTRRRLSRDENIGVLCGWYPEEGKWRRLALHDETLAPVVADILALGEGWEENSEERVRYFADYLAHEEEVLRDLAHLEVARAPYGVLVRFADRLPRAELIERLGNFRRLEWHALYILFLAQSDNPADRERIREEMAGAADMNLATRTAAWATAFLEIDGAKAVERLRDWYGEERDRRSGERRAVLAALVVHGDQGDPALRDSLVGLMGEFLRAESELAPEIVNPLGRWERDELAEPVAALLRESPGQFDTDATLSLRRYLRGVAERSEPDQPDASKPHLVEPPAAETGHSLLPLLAMVGLILLALVVGIAGKLRRKPSPQS